MDSQSISWREINPDESSIDIVISTVSSEFTVNWVSIRTHPASTTSNGATSRTRKCRGRHGCERPMTGDYPRRPRAHPAVVAALPGSAAVSVAASTALSHRAPPLRLRPGVEHGQPAPPARDLTGGSRKVPGREGTGPSQRALCSAAVHRREAHGPLEGVLAAGTADRDRPGIQCGLSGVHRNRGGLAGPDRVDRAGTPACLDRHRGTGSVRLV